MEAGSEIPALFFAILFHPLRLPGLPVRPAGNTRAEESGNIQNVNG